MKPVFFTTVKSLRANMTEAEVMLLVEAAVERQAHRGAFPAQHPSDAISRILPALLKDPSWKLTARRIHQIEIAHDSRRDVHEAAPVPCRPRGQ